MNKKDDSNEYIREEEIKSIQNKINNLSECISIDNLKLTDHPTEKQLDKVLNEIKLMTNQQRNMYLQNYLNKYNNNINIEHLPNNFATISDEYIKKKIILFNKKIQKLMIE